MWPFDRLFGKGPTTEDLQQGGWDLLGGSLGVEGDDTWQDFSDKELAEISRKNSLAYACIRRIAQTITEPPIEVGEPDGDGGFDVRGDHWAKGLLEHPNNLYDKRLFLQYLITRKLTTGRSLIWKWRNRRGTQVTELWPLPTHWVGIQTGGGSDIIKGYKVWQGDGRETLDVPKENMVNSYYPDPTSTWKAVGPLQAASRDYQMDDERENYVAEMMDNLNVPGLGIFAPEGMSTPKKKALRANLQDRSGKGNRGGTLFLEGRDVEAKLFNPLADLDLPGLISMTETRLCMAFGVPPELVGARTGLEHSTYSNKEEARASFYKETMVPIWRGLQSVFTRGLLWPEGENDLEVRFNLGGIAELQTDLKERAQRAATLYKNGVITRDEARAMVDKPPGETDYRIVPVGGIEEEA